jgi:carboxyl-terminal processing protease
MNDATQFGGIGAELHKAQPGDPLVIWRVFDGSPAQKAGLRSGDVIRGVNGKDISDYTSTQAVDLIRGTVGTPVSLEILSPGQSKARTVVVMRGQIQPPIVEYRMLANHVGYVQIYGFSQDTASALQGALDSLDGQGATSWVIDLRDNGGGLLDSVTQVLSMFLPKDTPLYYLTDNSGKRTEYKADGSVRAHIPPIVILTNDGTASGAELFAAGLSEHGLARVVGEKTAGCVGTGQLFPLSDGSGIQVTVAKMVTGTGENLNRVGLTPNVPVGMTVQDLASGSDPQLTKAVQVLTGST